jgi:hypothetical protein
VLRQLCLRAIELAEDFLAQAARARLRSQPGLRLVPVWSTRRISRTVFAELGAHGDVVRVMAALPDGRFATGGFDGRLLLWDPARPGADPEQLVVVVIFSLAIFYYAVSLAMSSETINRVVAAEERLDHEE